VAVQTPGEILQQLHHAIDAASSLPVSCLSGGEAIEWVCELHTVRSRLDALTCTSLAAIGPSATLDSGETGHRSVGGVVAARTRAKPRGPRSPGSDAILGNWLLNYPVFSAAFEQGLISADHVHAIRGRENRRTRCHLEPAQDYLVEAAQRCTWAEFTAVLAYWDNGADPDGEVPDEQQAKRQCNWTKRSDGTVTGNFTLDPLSGHAFITALEHHVQRLFRDDTETGNKRTTSQRRADALVELVTNTDIKIPATLIHLILGEDVLTDTLNRLADINTNDVDDVATDPPTASPPGSPPGPTENAGPGEPPPATSADPDSDSEDDVEPQHETSSASATAPAKHETPSNTNASPPGPASEQVPPDEHTTPVTESSPEPPMPESSPEAGRPSPPTPTAAQEPPPPSGSPPPSPPAGQPPPHATKPPPPADQPSPATPAPVSGPTRLPPGHNDTTPSPSPSPSPEYPPPPLPQPVPLPPSLPERPPGPASLPPYDPTRLPIDHDNPARRCELIDGTPIHPRWAFSALLSAQIRRLILSTDSQVLDLGRSVRTFPPHLKQLLLILARGRCQQPGCDAPASWLQADHLIPWSRGGPTNLTNGQILCDPHNKAKRDRLPRHDDAN